MVGIANVIAAGSSDLDQTVLDRVEVESPSHLNHCRRDIDFLLRIRVERALQCERACGHGQSRPRGLALSHSGRAVRELADLYVPSPVTSFGRSGARVSKKLQRICPFTMVAVFRSLCLIAGSTMLHLGLRCRRATPIRIATKRALSVFMGGTTLMVRGPALRRSLFPSRYTIRRTPIRHRSNARLLDFFSAIALAAICSLIAFPNRS